MHMPEKAITEKEPRPPVIAVMGHIDHGKSSLLDYIRKTKVVESEAGGITQHLSAYEVTHAAKEGESRKITFLDTPGHEAFQKMRSRGSAVADIAILVVSSEDGVKPQTLDAHRAIIEGNIPFVVALTKIDKPSANVERAKASLLENGIYLEGMGGDIPFVPISSKSGEGIPELLDVVLLLADLAELSGTPAHPAAGIVIESHTDPKKGIAATLIVKDGTLKSGQYVVAGKSIAPTRLMADFAGKNIKSASLSSPVTISGFSGLPAIGTEFVSFDDKREAEEYARSAEDAAPDSAEEHHKKKITLALVVKADVSGSIEAIEHELLKRNDDDVEVRIVARGVGTITENDVKFAGSEGKGAVIGFNTAPDNAALEWSRRLSIEIATFSVIYKLGEWVDRQIEAIREELAPFEPSGHAKVLKIFSASKQGQLVGARVEAGVIRAGFPCTIVRDGEIVEKGRIESIRVVKDEVAEVLSGKECGAVVLAGTPIMAGDIIESLPQPV